MANAAGETAEGSSRNRKDDKKTNPNAGNWRQRARLWSGLVLFIFCLSHFTNHAMGVISFSAMDKFSHWHYWIWRNPVGETLLLTAAVIHVGLALWRTAKRSTLKMPRWEFAQLVLGLYIPWTLIPHVVATMGLPNAFGISPTYEHMLTVLWPQGALMQSLLLITVWVHSMIGLHFWLRLYPAYHRLKAAAIAFAVAMPVLALWGFIEGSRRLHLSRDLKPKMNETHWEWLFGTTNQFRAIVFGLIILSLAVVLFRFISGTFARKLTVSFPGGLTVKAQPGASLLEMSRMNEVPIASVCGGRARCSTCRVRVLSGGEALPPAQAAEIKVLQRIDAEDDVRLACQLRPLADLQVQPLVSVKAQNVETDHIQDAYYWGVEQDVVIMFVDLRNFTGITETQLAYDIVYLLNEYLDQVSTVIRREGGHVDKFIGDGIMAIFGMETDCATGAKQALKACRGIEEVMEKLNQSKGSQFKDPIRLGVGLHVGQAILGRIGSAGSESGRGNLTALGDVVNTASRLETENKKHSSFLVVSKDVIDAAGARVPSVNLTEISVRGKTEPLQIFALRRMNTVLLDSDSNP